MTTTTTQITYRKTTRGEWVAYGPADLITESQTVTITKKSGETDERTVTSTGRTFTVDGTKMVYGYLAEREYTPKTTTATYSSKRSYCYTPSQWGGRATGGCENCGSYRAGYTATDSSGITGRVCRSCSFKPQYELYFA